ncbi:MAG: hypothetical protein Q9163_003748 [Psora crenata]
MASQQGQKPTQLGATFIPGGVDDFYMPGIISPAPQRSSITPEVPEKIQDNLAHLELAGSPVNRLSGLRSPPPIDGSGASFPRRDSSISDITKTSEHSVYSPSEQPTFSPFPPLRNRPTYVPPSDEEKESTLEKARLPVLKCNDLEVQLRWAQDALTYVEIASQHEARISENQAKRSQTPSMEHQLRVDAVNVVSFLAEQHHPKAEFLRGMWLEFGKFGFRMDKKEAFRCYQRAAQSGYSRAEYRIGMQFENSNDPEKAIKHYQLGIQGGDSASHYRLGMMTLLGQHGQPQDFEKGVRMISYAADSADENAPQGAYVFGMLQARELTQVTVPEQYLALNISGARFSIEKAAYLGFSKAQAKMGTAYELCQLGCDFNAALSLHYNALAAKQGEPEAEMSVSKWFLCGYDGLIEKSEELAFVYAQRAAQSGLHTAEFAMGYFYEVGIHVQTDLKMSRSWYQKAADHGNGDALARIDGIARSKTLSRKDHEKVAVAKIKSQYGSHRGKRPERYTVATPMPTISDDTVDMPEPSASTSRPAQHLQTPYPSNYGNYGPEARPHSAAPYPSNHGNYGPGARPHSAAPYPVNDGRGDSESAIWPASGPMYKNNNPRLGPSIVHNATAELVVSFPDSNYRGSTFPTFRPQQFPAQDIGRGQGAQPLNTPGKIGPQGYRPPGAVPPSPPVTASPTRPQSAQPATIDIGFSAPPDLSGADRRRFQKPSYNRPEPQNVLPTNPNYENSQAQINPERLSSRPRQSQAPGYGPSPSPSRPPISAGRTNVVATPPASQQTRPQSGANVLDKPPKVQDPGRPSNTPPPSGSIVKLQGKGPKTFQEMGVPASKNESDCRSQRKQVPTKVATSHDTPPLPQAKLGLVTEIVRLGTVMIIDYLSRGPPANLVHCDGYLSESAQQSHQGVAAYAAKALKELHESHIIAGKASGLANSLPFLPPYPQILWVLRAKFPSFFWPGKQLVYHAIQDPNDTLCLDDLAAMDREISSLRGEIATLKSNDKLLRSNLAAVNATMSAPELRAKVQSLASEKSELLARLGPLRKGGIKPVKLEEKQMVDMQWAMWKREAEGRRKIALELWEMGTEVLPEGKAKEEFWEDLGLEADQ